MFEQRVEWAKPAQNESDRRKEKYLVSALPPLSLLGKLIHFSFLVQNWRESMCTPRYRRQSQLDILSSKLGNQAWGGMEERGKRSRFAIFLRSKTRFRPLCDTARFQELAKSEQQSRPATPPKYRGKCDRLALLDDTFLHLEFVTRFHPSTTTRKKLKLGGVASL